MIPLRTTNRWVWFVVATYWGARLPQLTRLESVAIGHEADEAAFYLTEPRVTFRDTLIQCSAEWRAMERVA